MKAQRGDLSKQARMIPCVQYRLLQKTVADLCVNFTARNWKP